MASSAKIDSPSYFEDPINPSTFAKVFVPTGSNNGSVLVSLNESNIAGSIKSVFAGIRMDHNNQLGILVTVLFLGTVDPISSVVLLTVQQDGGVNYGQSEVFIPHP
jgi:hypothetical protein